MRGFRFENCIEGDRERILAKGTNFQLEGEQGLGMWWDGMVIILHNTVLYTRNFLEGKPLHVLTTRKK